MGRRQTVEPVTPLGHALEAARVAAGLTRVQAYGKAGFQSHVLWNRLLTEERRFDPGVVQRAARAVGMNFLEALRLARVAVVPNDTRHIVKESDAARVHVIPDDTARVMTMSEVEALQNAS